MRVLNREEMKKVIGGTCSISANCYKDIYNPNTHHYDRTQVGTVGCSGVRDCKGSSYGVTCLQEDGHTDAGTCPAGSFVG